MKKLCQEIHHLNQWLKVEPNITPLSCKAFDCNGNIYVEMAYKDSAEVSPNSYSILTQRRNTPQFDGGDGAMDSSVFVHAGDIKWVYINKIVPPITEENISIPEEKSQDETAPQDEPKVVKPTSASMFTKEEATVTVAEGYNKNPLEPPALAEAVEVEQEGYDDGSDSEDDAAASSSTGTDKSSFKRKKRS